MKEAAGEANMTVITLVLIGIVAAIMIPVVNNAMTSMAKKAPCNELGGKLSGDTCTYPGGSCTVTKNTDGSYSCN